MSVNNQIINRLNSRRKRINRMVMPWTRSLAALKQPGKDQGKIDMPPGIRYKKAAQKMQVLDKSRMGDIQAEKIKTTGEAITRKFENVQKLIHFSPKITRDSTIWSEMERVYPQTFAAQEEPPAQPGELRRGSVIQKMEMLPREGQSLSAFKDQARGLAKMPKKKQPAQKPKLAPRDRMFSRVQEISPDQPGVEQKPEEIIKPASPPLHQQPPIIQREMDRPVVIKPEIKKVEPVKHEPGIVSEPIQDIVSKPTKKEEKSAATKPIVQKEELKPVVAKPVVPKKVEKKPIAKPVLKAIAVEQKKEPERVVSEKKLQPNIPQQIEKKIEQDHHISGISTTPVESSPFADKKADPPSVEQTKPLKDASPIEDQPKKAPLVLAAKPVIKTEKPTSLVKKAQPIKRTPKPIVKATAKVSTEPARVVQRDAEPTVKPKAQQKPLGTKKALPVDEKKTKTTAPPTLKEQPAREIKPQVEKEIPEVETTVQRKPEKKAAEMPLKKRVEKHKKTVETLKTTDHLNIEKNKPSLISKPKIGLDLVKKFKIQPRPSETEAISPQKQSSEKPREDPTSMDEMLRKLQIPSAPGAKKDDLPLQMPMEWAGPSKQDLRKPVQKERPPVEPQKIPMELARVKPPEQRQEEKQEKQKAEVPSQSEIAVAAEPSKTPVNIVQRLAEEPEQSVEKSSPAIDLEKIAEEVFPLVKRILEIESERTSSTFQ
ncbi:MAG: hypothetical protein JEZ06_04580 [Anaerolineaceae bacterium]|nr:hypothetical protein [Anaerolineaceae bacterium]